MWGTGCRDELRLDDRRSDCLDTEPAANIMVRCQAKSVANDTGTALVFDHEETGLLCVMIDLLRGARTTQD